MLKKVDIIIDWLFENISSIKKYKKKRDSIIQFLRFCIIGMSNTFISYVVYVLVLYVFQLKKIYIAQDYLIAQVIAFFISVAWSFHWNNGFVFVEEKDKKRNRLKTLMKTYVSYAFTGLFLNSLFSLIWIEWIGLPKIFAPIINLFISIPLNFLINKLWAFKM